MMTSPHTTQANYAVRFLQAVVVLIGIGTLTFLLWEPHIEGVNAHATSLSDIYFDDPFLVFAYIASIPFFVALYQAFTLLGYVGRKKIFSQLSVKALQIIKYCALVTIPFIVIGVTWLLSVESDDRPPILAMGVVTTFIAIIAATVADMLKRNVQQVVERKS